jgi:hypothetical protein
MKIIVFPLEFVCFRDVSLDAIFGQLGVNLDQFYPTWELLGPNLDQLGANLVQLEVALGHFGPNFGQLKAKFDPTWANLGPPRANLGRPWTNLGPTWANFGPTWSQCAPNFTFFTKIEHYIYEMDDWRHEKSLFFFWNLYVLGMSALMQS